LVSDRTKRSDAINKGVSAISATARGGFGNVQNNASYTSAKNEYVASGGNAEEFDTVVKDRLRENYKDNGNTTVNEKGEIISGTFPNGGGGASGLSRNKVWNDWDSGVTIKVGNTSINGVHTLDTKAVEAGEDYWHNDVPDDEIQRAITALSGGTPEEGWIALYNNVPYVYRGSGNKGRWVQIHNNPQNNSSTKYEEVRKAMFDYLNGYETGGLADFTGPAWLDGTKSRPEYVLNADQTERFFALVDVLEGYDKDAKTSKAGDNYFDIEINVEKLESDYDVEQVAEKIRNMIYEDATYRNVNAVNYIR
jgi:hypothetical protein